MRKLKVEELNRDDIEGYKKKRKLPFVVVLDNIRSMQNTGSVFRTSDAFLVEKIFLCGITARPPHREIERSALGATESVDWEYAKNVRDLILQLKKEDYVIVAVEQMDDCITLDQLEINHAKKHALVFGNEVTGISDSIIDLIDVAVEIPQFGTKHSLNISVAAGIAIYEIGKLLTNQK